MNAHQNLGRLERVDVRDVWKTEAGDFTPWLGREENIALLGETIGIDLEVEAQEKFVGPFRADILCKDTATDDWVLIENQLERTNHVHLGQLLTYAAGLHAATIVWIADVFTDEHRAAQDWLNEITGEKFNIFGLEVEIWRIGDSALAPKFNAVSKPNEWTKTGGSVAGGEGLSDTRKLQLEYWGKLRELMRERKGRVRPKKPQPRHWMSFSLGRSKIHMSAFANTQKKRVGVALILQGPNAKTNFFALKRDREAIDNELSAKLTWEEKPGKKQSRVFLRREDFDPLDQSQWPAQLEWLYHVLEDFHRVLSPRVKALDPNAADVDDDGDEDT